MRPPSPQQPDDDCGIADLLPPLEGVTIAAGRVGDHEPDLWPEERAAIARAHARRVREFATGRALARRAMAAMGIDPAAILRADDRQPVWPPGVKGSITHTGDLAVAAIAREGGVTGLGIDLERGERVVEKLFGRIFTESERRRVAEEDPRWPGLAFSAKEAVFKAVNPLVGRYIGFQEAEVDVDWARATLRFRYLGPHEPNRIMEAGVGHFCFFEQYVLTVFIIR